MTEQNLSADLAAAKVEIAEARHDLRNMRMVVNGNVSEIAQLKNSLDRLKARSGTGAAAVAVALGLLGWLIEMSLSR